MNSVKITGRLTRDPELRYGASNQKAVCRFGVAINRGKDRDGKDLGADFPNVVVFGRQAENCERYLAKGLRVLIEGHIRTGSYKDKEGRTVYTTDVIADRVEFIDWGSAQQRESGDTYDGAAYADIPDTFQAIDEDIPF